MFLVVEKRSFASTTKNWFLKGIMYITRSWAVFGSEAKLPRSQPPKILVIYQYLRKKECLGWRRSEAPLLHPKHLLSKVL